MFLPRYWKTALVWTSLLCAALLAASPAAAMDTFMASPRAMGMGGASVAAVDDTSAQYYNPAAFGFFGRQTADGSRIEGDNNNLGRKDWGADLTAAGGYRLLNDFGLYADTLADIDLDDLSSGIDSESDVAELIDLVSSLEGIAASDTAVNADLSSGLAFRAGHTAFGLRGFAKALGRVNELDRENLGVETTGMDDFADQLRGADIPAFDEISDYQFQVFSAAQRQQLADALGVAVDDEAIQKLDYTAARQGIESDTVEGAVSLLSTVASESALGDGSLEDNTTSVLLRGFGVAEAALSYGYALSDRISVGGNLKFMRGRVYGNQVVVFDDDADDILAETDEKYEESNSFGVDLGVMARFSKFNFGIIGRNLNAPEFDGFEDQVVLSTGQAVDFSVDDVELDPQVTAGVAYIPFTTLTLAADLDLTENDVLFSSYNSRNFHLGAEWDIWRFLALRVGAYKNLAEDDIGWVYTAGLGLNLWAVRLDVSGAMADDMEDFDGDEVPVEGRAAFEFSVDF